MTNYLKAALCAVAAIASSQVAHAGTVSYTCGAAIGGQSGSICTALNSTVAADYSNTFSNANASIYIDFGEAGLGQTAQYQEFVSYSTYLTALTAASSGNAVDTSALASLPGTEPGLYSGGDIEITSALAQALGITSQDGGAPIVGATTSLASCTTIGSDGCYNAVMTLATPTIVAGYGQSYYYGSGPQDPTPTTSSPSSSTRPTRFWEPLPASTSVTAAA